MTDRFSLESKAFTALGALMQQAGECRALFESAQLPLPEPLRRMLGDESPEDAAGAANGKVVVPPPKMPGRPATWESDWVWLPTEKLTPQTVVCALLRAAGKALAPKDILDKCGEVGVDVIKGSLANIGTRLSTGIAPKIRREGGAWELVDTSNVPTLHNGHAWGPPAFFDKQELAAHRRAGVVHLLNAYDDGLQIVQITKILRQCEWMRAPVTKDLVKIDLQQLQEAGSVKRVGNSGKWRTT